MENRDAASPPELSEAVSHDVTSAAPANEDGDAFARQLASLNIRDSAREALESSDVWEKIDIKTVIERIGTMVECLGKKPASDVIQVNPGDILRPVHVLHARIRALVADVGMREEEARNLLACNFAIVSVPSREFGAKLVELRTRFPSMMLRSRHVSQHPDCFLPENQAAKKTVSKKAVEEDFLDLSLPDDPDEICRLTPTYSTPGHLTAFDRKEAQRTASTVSKLTGMNEEAAWSHVSRRPWLWNPVIQAIPLLRRLRKIGVKMSLASVLERHDALFALGLLKIEMLLDLLEEHHLPLPADLNDLAIPQGVVRYRHMRLSGRISPEKQKEIYIRALFARTQREFHEILHASH